MKKGVSVRELTWAAAGTALIALSAWISVPSLLPSMVPFTMQTFGVCLAAAVLGARGALWSVVCYILLGAAGVPVFAGFRGGAAVLLGPTGGYIAGFVLTALTVGLAADRRGEDTVFLLLTMAAGVVLCYAFGTAWFVWMYSRTKGEIGLATALGWCVAPYLIPDGIKITLAALTAARLRRALRRVTAQ